MNTSDIFDDNYILDAAERAYYTGSSVDELRLSIAELITKAGAGYYNSHTEEALLRKMKVLKSDRTANKKGRDFLMRMLYASSRKKPEAFLLMQLYRD